MNFPRREEATNKELILTIIEIQGYLSRYGKSHTNWHETLNEVIERLERAESEKKEEISKDDARKIVHDTIYDFFDDSETFNDKDELLLKINKAICNNIMGY